MHRSFAPSVPSQPIESPAKDRNSISQGVPVYGLRLTIGPGKSAHGLFVGIMVIGKYECMVADTGIS